VRIHIVQRGDTLWKISRNYGVSFDELKRLNAHLANPEYIVPGMKIFIPDEKKMESMNHPYSNNHRPVKKEMMKEEVKVQPSMPIQPKQQYQPAPPVKQYQPMAPMQPMQPVKSMPPMQPMPQMPPIQPVQQYQPMPAQPVQPTIIQPAPQIHHYSMPYHMMPVPDVDMTPSPIGWKLIESTSIHINIHNDFDSPDEAVVAPIQAAPPIPPVPQMQPVQPMPLLEDESPLFIEESPEGMHMMEEEQQQQYQPMQMAPCMHPLCYPEMMHPQMQMHPHLGQQMHPQFHHQMHPHHHGNCPCIPIYCVPAFPHPQNMYQSY